MLCAWMYVHIVLFIQPPMNCLGTLWNGHGAAYRWFGAQCFLKTEAISSIFRIISVAFLAHFGQALLGSSYVSIRHNTRVSCNREL